MNDHLLRHPELINGPNPLLEALAPFIPFSKMPHALIRQPLKVVDWRSMSPEYRAVLLDQHKDHYWPTRQIIDVAESIQTVMRFGLVARNPLSGPEQRRINTLALAGDIKTGELTLEVRHPE